MRSVLLLFCGSILLMLPSANAERIYKPPKKMVVAVSVAHVRSEPVDHDGTYQYDERQETQVELGEPIFVHERNGAWVRVECPEQQEFSHHQRWEGYPGWMRLSDLTTDLSRVHQLRRSTESVSELRVRVLSQAQRHLGNAYLWGGRSLYDPNNKARVTGVDCSGLINWAFRQMGWFVPRDAHEQFLRARPRTPEQLKPGDLIFLAKTDKPEKIVHVAFYAGGDELIEAPQTGEVVRRISLTKRFGKSLSELKSGDIVGDRVISFGTLFMEDEE